MGVCYVSKGPQQIVVNSKLKNQDKNESNPKANLLYVKTNQLIEFKNRIKQIYYSNSFRGILLSNFLAVIKKKEH